MVIPISQWLGSGLGQSGSTSNIGAITPAAWTAAFRCSTMDPSPSRIIDTTSAVAINKTSFHKFRFSLTPVTHEKAFVEYLAATQIHTPGKIHSFGARWWHSRDFQMNPVQSGSGRQV